MNSPFIIRSGKGVAISIDALLAVILFIALLGFISTKPAGEEPITQPMLFTNQRIDDAISVLDSTGLIMQSIENADFDAIAIKLSGLLPENSGFRLEMVRYESPLDMPDIQCRNPGYQDFETCFPYDTNVYALGSEVPEDRGVFHGKKIFIKKEPGQCDIEDQGELQEKKPLQTRLFFEGAPDENISFGSMVRDSSTGQALTELWCDQEAIVDLNLSSKTSKRTPVDIVFGAAKNSKMGECAIAGGNTFYAFQDDSNTRSTFTKAIQFTVAAAGAIDVDLNWTASCTPGAAGNCPQFYIKKSTSEYGSGRAGTLYNSLACNVHDKPTQSTKAYYYDWAKRSYLAIGSALGQAGLWEVYVKNPNGIRYNLKVKAIINKHYGESSNSVQGWNEPIAKVEIAKAMITDFTLRADWHVYGPDSNHDMFAYAQIGNASTSPSNTGCSIQPSSGMRNAGDLSPPFSSQMKNLDVEMSSVPGPAYSYALDHTGIINDTLRGSFPAVARTKIAIIYGDSANVASPPYSIVSAIADAQAGIEKAAIYYYTIDFNENNMPGQPCQNQDLLNLADGTSGVCYPAADEGALQGILNYIAADIVSKSVFSPDAQSAKITLPFDDFEYDWLYDFNPALGPNVTWDGSTLVYDNLTLGITPWTAQFKMKVPCDFSDCDLFLQHDQNVEVPPANSTLDYSYLEVPQPHITWPSETVRTLPLKYTDLKIDYLGGHFYENDNILIEYRVSNIGYFNVDLADIYDTTSPLTEATVNFYTGPNSLQTCPKDGGTWFDKHYLGDKGVLDALFGANPVRTFLDTEKTLYKSGYLCLYLNGPALVPDTRNVRECSANNWVLVNCAIPKNYLYVLDYWVWQE